MTTERAMREAHRRGVAVLREARWGTGEQCMCSECTNERMAEGFQAASLTTYPQLRFIPQRQVKYNDYRSDPLEYLKYIAQLRKSNNEARRQFTSGQKKCYCKWCGRLHDKRDCYEHRGEWYCGGCWGSLFECTECHTMAHTQRRTHRQNDTGDHIPVCRPCAVEKMLICYVCDMQEYRTHSHKLKGSRDEVGNYVIYNICRYCYEAGLEDCFQCGRKTHKSVSVQKNEYWFCPVCREEASGIQEFNYKPLRPRFRKGKGEGKVTPKAFHMGFELEVAPHHSFIEPEAMVHMVKDHVGRQKLYAMQDGSISQGAGVSGMEIASHPFTWEYYRKKGIHDWDKMCLFFRKHGWKASYSGLGIHVHTTKAAWGTHQIYKLLKFVHDNTTFVQEIAQRGSTEYCHYDHFYPADQKLVAKEKLNRQNNHYNAINLNNGDSGKAAKTIEFRMFQATLEPFYFHKNIEFTYAVWLFTAAKSVKNMTRISFIDFVCGRKKEFPCLTGFIENLNYRRVL
jgi:hypothetical protein